MFIFKQIFVDGVIYRETEKERKKKKSLNASYKKKCYKEFYYKHSDYTSL